MTPQQFGLLCGSLAVLVTPASLSRAAPAHASANTDLRCLAVNMAMTGSRDPATRSVGMQGVSYYLGRVDGGGRGRDLENRLAEQFLSMTANDVNAQVQTCSRAMATRGAAFQAISKRLQERITKARAAAPVSPAQAAAPPVAPPPR